MVAQQFRKNGTAGTVQWAERPSRAQGEQT